MQSTQSLVEAQIELERTATADGVERFLKSQKTTLDNEGPQATVEASKLIKGSIPLVSKEIESYLSTASNGGKGRTPKALKYLSQIDPDKLAYVALAAVYSGTIKSNSVGAVQAHIGSTVETELMVQHLEKLRDRKVTNRLQERLMRQGSAKSRSKAFRKMIKSNLEEGEELPSLDQDTKVKIGEPLVNAVLLSLSEIFELHTGFVSSNNSPTTIRLTDEGVRLLASLKDAAAWLAPVHRPMVVMPRRWEDMDTGCYYDEKARSNVKLVRTFNSEHKRLIRDAIKGGQMDYVLEAINIIQETPWAINTQVLDVVKWAYDNDIQVDGLPRKSLMPIPARMSQETWESLSPTERKGVRLNIGAIREKNRGITADRSVIDRDLKDAEYLSTFERFYLPHNMDFRGRVYPVPHFNHQRADHIKALFRFADGMPLGEFGAGWLSVHLANCGDFNKVAKKDFDARIQWVESNEHLILSAAADPTGAVDWWKEADSPFMFLAACFEYAAWVEGGRSDDFVSYLPVALDGTNSGLQHYSAALRCSEEAALVSLLPTDAPTDLYQAVADRVAAIAEEEADDDPMASLCSEIGITRSLVKRNVMTFPYSSEQFGFRQQILEDTMRPLNDLVLTGQLGRNPYSITRDDGTEDGGFRASGYLASRIFRGVKSTVRRAADGMDFFKGVASALAHEALPMVWTTPVGLPVMHKYSVWDTKTVELFLYDKNVPVVSARSKDKLDAGGRGVIRRVVANIRTRPTSRIDKDKARSAVAPNVVHSMDGSHLQLTALAAAEEGMRHFAFIHDSFGTHAGNTHRFFQIIRETFVDMYTHYCPFEAVLEAAKETLSCEGQERLPELPQKGDMDLQQVLDADYAFA